MIQAIAKYVGGKVLTAVLVVTVAMVVVWYWRMDPAARAAMWHSVRMVLLWVGLAAALPWATFFVPPLVVKAESNLVSGLALAAYVAVDAVLAFWLAGWDIEGTLSWAVVLLGLLSAGVYNFVVCEFLAERAEAAL